MNLDYSHFLQNIMTERYVIQDLTKQSGDWVNILRQNGVEAIWHQAIKTPEGELCRHILVIFYRAYKVSASK